MVALMENTNGEKFQVSRKTPYRVEVEAQYGP
jgi:hypothetical protein